MSGSLKITDERVKVIQQYHQFKDLLFDIAGSAKVDISNIDELERHVAVNILLKSFLGEKSYSEYIQNLKLPSNQIN